MIPRSAEVLTWVAAVSELLPGTASAVPEDTVAVLDRLAVWDASSVRTCVIDGGVVDPSEARVQVTVVVPVQVQPVPVAEKSVVPEGSGSETDRKSAVEGKKVVTDKV